MYPYYMILIGTNFKKRFKNPLKDAETFNFDKKNYLKAIGDKTNSLEKIKGQYMGLFKITPRGWKNKKTFNKIS